MLPARYVRGLLAHSSHILHILDYFSINYSDRSQPNWANVFLFADLARGVPVNAIKQAPFMAIRMRACCSWY